MDLLKKLKIANKERDLLFFKHFDKWETVDWSNAVAGETGELCNIVKKMKRSCNDSDRDLTIEDIANEAADIVIYLEILCQNCGIDLSDAIVRKFNEVSERNGLIIFL